jgi:hypothetical protein
LLAQAEPAAKRHEPSADPADGPAVVLAEVGNRLVVRDQAPHEPHDLNVAPRLPLQPAARLHPVQIAVDVELQVNRRMIGRTARVLRINAPETQSAKIRTLDNGLGHTDRIALADPVLKAFRKKCRLIAFNALNKTLHSIPPNVTGES